MNFFGVEFPERERPRGGVCGASMIFVERTRNDRGEVRKFVCYDCPSAIFIPAVSNGNEEVKQVRE
jgi:hypothetical protein